MTLWLGRKKSIALFIIGFVATLHGCRSGSDSSQVTVFPVDRVITELATFGGQFGGTTHTGSTGIRETISVNYTPVFSGQFTRQTTLAQNGVTLNTSTSTIDFLSSPFTVTGWRVKGWSDVAISQSVSLPVSANIGDRSAITFGSIVNDVNGRSVDMEWTLDAHSTTTADLCIGQRTSGDFISTNNIDCFEIDGTGKIMSFKEITRIHSKGIDYDVIYQ